MSPAVLSLAELSRFIFKRWEKERYFALVIPMLPSYLDESSDEKRKDVFCVGVLLTDEKHLQEIQDAWVRRLKTPDDIEYFRTSCVKGVHKPFFKLRRKYGPTAQSVTNKIRADLEAILISSTWIGFGIGILVSEYQEAWNSTPIVRRFFEKDPVEAAYSSIMLEVARAVRKNAHGHRVAYFIDESTYSDKIIAAFKATKINHPVIAKSMATIAPLDDKITPPLQMADLVASVIKDVFLHWLKMGRPKDVPLDTRWRNNIHLIGTWDKECLIRNVNKTLNNKRYKAGLLAKRELAKPTGRDLKIAEKKRRRELINKFKNS